MSGRKVLICTVNRVYTTDDISLTDGTVRCQHSAAYCRVMPELCGVEAKHFEAKDPTLSTKVYKWFKELFAK